MGDFVLLETGPATRWIDLTSEQIAEVAHNQIEGGYGSVSDALTALHLIEAIAHRLADVQAAIAAVAPPSPPRDGSHG